MYYSKRRNLRALPIASSGRRWLSSTTTPAGDSTNWRTSSNGLQAGNRSCRKRYGPPTRIQGYDDYRATGVVSPKASVMGLFSMRYGVYTPFTILRSRLQLYYTFITFP